MLVVEDIASVRAARYDNLSQHWGLVPTMGYLHEGHMSLVRRARRENDFVAVSIFVNPAQFNNPGDLDKYPRNEERDLAMLREAGVDLVWAPQPSTVYPTGFATYVNVEGITEQLEGASRPGHFRGVTTVVSKLFNVFAPQRAYFGQKDAQQAATVRRMVEDLNFDLELVVCETVRASDGLALSSRNARLTDTERTVAPEVYRALQHMQSSFAAGERSASSLRETFKSHIDQFPSLELDYISVSDLDSLSELDTVEGGALLCAAVFLGEVRLIDNVTVPAEQ
ncbi:MAG: pantoate--beta-alanine ligase [Gammaproteobacteria bacterium]|nr:pantoate--beta-alanine ligase [Gammaproteobacteria bacterium]